MQTVTQLHGVDPNELKEQIANAVHQQLQPILAKFEPHNPEKLLTKQQTAEMLICTTKSVENWTAEGRLIAYQIGSSIRYKYAEVVAALERIYPNKSA